MLIGSYRHQIDAKNRFRVPTKLKSELGSNFIITKGVGGCLFAFSSEGFEDLYKKVSMIPLFDEEAQKPVRKFLSSAFETEEDGQARILLPKELKKFAGITKNIVFVGAGNRVEIWAEEVWDKIDEDDDFDASLKALKDYGV